MESGSATQSGKVLRRHLFSGGVNFLGRIPLGRHLDQFVGRSEDLLGVEICIPAIATGSRSIGYNS